MRAKLILLSILAATLITVPAVYFAQAQKPTATTTQAPIASAPLNADTIFNLVNAERTKAGLKPLIRDARLDATAQAKADEMVRLNYFAHNNPATGKNSAWDNPIFNKLCVTSSENISMGWQNDNQVVNGWIGSTAHREAILLPEYTLTGLAISGDKVVQHFCIAN